MELTVENTSMSEYEMLRMKRIQSNKQQFVEHMRQIATDSKEVSTIIIITLAYDVHIIL